MNEALGSVLRTNMNQAGMAVFVCNAGSWEVEPRGSEAQSHPQGHRKFESSQGYMRLSLKKKKRVTNNIITYVMWDSPLYSMNTIG